MIEPIELTYELDLLQGGRSALRRWRWELWHGPRLLAAGWRASALHAQRALRAHAFRYAHRLHGLHPLRPDAAHTGEAGWSEDRLAIRWGELHVVLRPRALVDATA